MVAINVVLVGVPDDVFQDVQRVLDKFEIAVQGRYSNAEELLEQKKQLSSQRILLIAQANQASDAQHIQQLHDTFPGWPIIALIQEKSEPNLILAVNRAGADQIVTIPMHADDLEAALSLIHQRFVKQVPNSTVISISGSVAGCGVSTLALNLADIIAHDYRQHTLLIETAQQMATQAINLNIRPLTTVTDLLIDEGSLDATRIKKAVIHVDARFDVLAGPMDITAAGTALKGMPKLIHAAREMADALVIDVMANFDDTHFQTLWSSDQILLVLEQTIPSIRAANMMKDALLRARPPKKVQVVVNKYDPAITNYTEEAIKELLQVQRIHTIPDDRKHVLLAAAEGKPLRKLDGNLPIVKAMRQLTGHLLGFAETHERSHGLLNRLTRFLHS
ncbi:MAG: hypothetical protein JNJ77_11560 [Planctomycetia bacterium]|nr:hypothetical protein [Planctomycetia bacterium]